MVVSRLVYFLDSAKQVLRIQATWMAKGFVSADIVCFVVQAIGGGLMAGGQYHPRSADLGKKIYMAGCSIQLVCVVVFVFVAAAFYRSVVRDTRASTAKTRHRWIQPLFWVIFLVLILIVVRTALLFTNPRLPFPPAPRPHKLKRVGTPLGTHHLSFGRVQPRRRQVEPAASKGMVPALPRRPADAVCPGGAQLGAPGARPAWQG